MERDKKYDSFLKELEREELSGYYEEACTIVAKRLEKLNDIAGVRAVCYFLDDVYQLAELLMGFPEYEFVKLKDYVKKPKTSGYQSIHLIMRVPVENVKVKVEIQIRTQAMDFWSDIEHHFIYKTPNMNMPECEEEFLKCSKSIRKIDKQMLKIRKKIEKQLA